MATFSEQHKLPRFPVPDLEGTLQRFVRSALPFCADAQAEADLRGKAAAFLAAPDARARQEWLVDFSKRPDTESWLYDIWMRAAYHGWVSHISVP